MGRGGGRHNTLVSKHRTVLPYFFCAHHPPWPLLFKDGGTKRAVKKIVENKKGCQSFYMHTFQLMPTTYLVCCTLNQYFQNPTETIPSLSLKGFKRKTKTKTPQVFQFLDLTNQQACSGHSLRTQGSRPPLTALWYQSQHRINSSTTTDLEEASGLTACLWLWWTQKQNILSRSICCWSLSKTVITKKGTNPPTFA